MHQHDRCDHDHAHRDLAMHEEPLDAANQSLSDALRASFGILKLIMVVLVVLYFFSNVRRIDSHEQAVVLRLGKLQPKTYEPGLIWAFPFPVDEIIPLPTKSSNELSVDSHTFQRTPDEIGKPLSYIARGSGGLNPALDGALLTADAGLVHVQWKISFKVDDLIAYVSRFHTRGLEAAEELIRTLVETTGIHVASELTAQEMIRTRVSDVQSEMMRRINEGLTTLESGLQVTRLELYEPTPPIPVRQAFDNTQRAENTKEKKIQDARKDANKRLNEAAGAAHERLVRLLDEIDGIEKLPEGPGKDRSIQELQAESDRMLLEEVEGRAGRTIRDASSYLSVMVSRMQGDLELYRTLLPEYQRNPELLIERLWERARQALLANPEVIKIFRPAGAQIRLKIPFDPEQARVQEEQRLKEEEFDPSKLRPQRWGIVGPVD